MAILTGGTSRLNNSGQLQSMSSLDATTAATIGAAGGVSSTVTTTSSVASVEFTLPNPDKNYFLVFDKVTLGGTAGYMRFYWQAPSQTNWRTMDSKVNLMTLNGGSFITSNSGNIAYNSSHLISGDYYLVQCTCMITGARNTTGNLAQFNVAMHYVSTQDDDIQVRSSFTTSSTGLTVNKIKVDPSGPTISNGSRFVMYEI